MIALTGFARPEDRRQALGAGFIEHMGKPLQLDALLSTVAKLGLAKQP